MENKREIYSLYQTFSQNIPIENLSAADKKYIIKEKQKFTKSQEIAFVRLILEHYYRLETEDLDITKLPYGGIDENNTITFDIKSNFPKDLLWILFRFTKMCTEEVS